MNEREDVEALVRETCRWRTDGNMVSWVEFEDVLDLVERVRAAERERLAAEVGAATEPPRPDDSEAERGRRIGMQDAERIIRSEVLHSQVRRSVGTATVPFGDEE